MLWPLSVDDDGCSEWFLVVVVDAVSLVGGCKANITQYSQPCGVRACRCVGCVLVVKSVGQLRRNVFVVVFVLTEKKCEFSTLDQSID